MNACCKYHHRHFVTWYLIYQRVIGQFSWCVPTEHANPCQTSFLSDGFKGRKCRRYAASSLKGSLSSHQAYALSKVSELHEWSGAFYFTCFHLRGANTGITTTACSLLFWDVHYCSQMFTIVRNVFAQSRPLKLLYKPVRRHHQKLPVPCVLSSGRTGDEKFA